MTRILLIFCLFTSSLIAQEVNLDSMKSELNKKALADTSRIHLLTEIGQETPIFRTSYWDSIASLCKNLNNKTSNEVEKNFAQLFLAAALSNKGYILKIDGYLKEAYSVDSLSLDVITKLLSKKNIANIREKAQLDKIQTMNNMATILVDKGDVAGGAALHQKCYEYRLEIGDEEGAALSLNNLAYVYGSKGDVEKALEYYFKSRKIREKLNDYKGLAQVYGNIATLYADYVSKDLAIQYHKQAYALWKKSNIQTGEVTSWSNIGVILLLLNLHDSACVYFDKAMKLSKSINYEPGIALTNYNYGHYYSVIKNFAKSIDHYKMALDFHKEVGNKRKVAECEVKLGELSWLTKNYSNAKKYGEDAYKYAHELGFPNIIEASASILYRVYSKNGDYKKAFEMYEVKTQMHDSLQSDKNKNLTVRKQLKYDYEKKAAADSIKNAEAQRVTNAQLEAQQASLKSEATQRYVLYGGLILVIGFLIFVFNRFRLTKKQKKIIEEQKKLVDESFHQLAEKNKEVMDSITYARRIQRALITSEHYIEKILKSIKK